MENGIGTLELVILLVIAFVIFFPLSGNRLSTMAQALRESINAFKQPDSTSGEFRQNSIPLTLAGVGVTLIGQLNVTKAITETQALVSIGVLLVWILTGWLLFRRK